MLLTVAALIAAGCQATPERPEPQPTGEIRTLPEPAPTASEMEGGLAETNGNHAADPQVRRVEVRVAETERPPEARPKTMPEVRSSDNPVIDETARMRTRDLHGYDFPGLESVAEPQMAKVEEPTPKAQPKPQPEPQPAPEPEQEPEPEAPTDPEPEIIVAHAEPAVDGSVEPMTMEEAETVEPTYPRLSAFRPVDPQIHESYFGDYLIGAGDILEFESFNDPNLSRELTVRYDGFVSLPLIPDMRVEDHTREEAEAKIREAYRRIFRDPQLSLLVRETASKTYAVIGDIEEPGEHEIGDLFDDSDGVGDAPGMEIEPERVDFGFELAGDHGKRGCPGGRRNQGNAPMASMPVGSGMSAGSSSRRKGRACGWRDAASSRARVSRSNVTGSTALAQTCTSHSWPSASIAWKSTSCPAGVRT